MIGTEIDIDVVYRKIERRIIRCAMDKYPDILCGTLNDFLQIVHDVLEEQLPGFEEDKS